MESIMISIITPCYNVEKYIAECLDSIISQSLSEIEVFCFDDGSTDNTLSILHDYQKRDSRIYVISQENRGPSVARNKGLLLAQGEYICFVDADDMLKPDTLKKCYSLACEYSADLVLFNAEIFFDNEEFETQFQSGEAQANIDYFDKDKYIRKGYEKYNNKNTPITGAALFSEMYPKNDYRVPIWLSLFRKDFICKHQFRFIEGIWHADDDFTFKTLLSAEAVVFSEDVMYLRRLRPDSVMTKPIGRSNVISRIIGQQQMQIFLETIKEDLTEEELNAAKLSLYYRKQKIVQKYLPYLSDGIEDLAYIKILHSLNSYEESAVQNNDSQSKPIHKRNRFKTLINKMLDS